MSNPRNDREAVIEAIQAAKRVHLEGTPIGGGGWVDVFGAILRADLALMFKPLKGLYGAYLPPTKERRAGVLINANHPLALQRYTAAHEFGHHRMGHSPSLDGEEEIMPRAQATRRNPREVAADSFAAYYLMPFRLLDERLRAMGRAKGEIPDPASVYALSLSFGVSYAAMVRHLEETRRNTATTSARLLEATPKSVKQHLLGSLELEDAHSDVREFQMIPEGLVTLRVGDTLILTLPNHTVGGYQWQMDGPADEALSVRTQVSGTELPHDQSGISAPEKIVMRCSAAGIRTATLTERRPWEPPEQAPLNKVDVAVEVLARPAGWYRSSLAGA